jgi:hypothetical protein
VGKTPVCLSVWFECRYLGWRNARTVSNFFYTSHMVKDYYLTLLQDLNKGQGLHLTKLYTATKDLTKDSATLTGWCQTKQSGEGNILSIAHAGIFHSISGIFQRFTL